MQYRLNSFLMFLWGTIFLHIALLSPEFPAIPAVRKVLHPAEGMSWQNSNANHANEKPKQLSKLSTKTFYAKFSCREIWLISLTSLWSWILPWTLFVWSFTHRNDHETNQDCILAYFMNGGCLFQILSLKGLHDFWMLTAILQPDQC